MTDDYMKKSIGFSRPVKEEKNQDKFLGDRLSQVFQLFSVLLIHFLNRKQIMACECHFNNLVRSISSSSSSCV